MTVPATEAIGGPYVGNGIQDEFPFPFEIKVSTDVEVWINDGTTNGVILTSLYTVDFTPSVTGGTVVLNDPLADTYLLSILRNVEFEQLTVLNRGQEFDPKVIEDMSDELTFQTQFLNQQAISEYVILNARIDDIILEAGSGNVVSSATIVTDGEVVVFEGVGGKKVKKSGYLIADMVGDISDNADDIADMVGDISDNADDIADNVINIERITHEITGGILSNATDADHDITVSPGYFYNSTNAIIMAVSVYYTKKLDAFWTIGDNTGGLASPTTTKTGTFTSIGTAVTGTGTSFDTELKAGDGLLSASNGTYAIVDSVTDATNIVLIAGFTVDVSIGEAVDSKASVEADTWYHFFVIENGVTLFNYAGFDTDVDATNLLADAVATGANVFRRRGRVLTDASANIIPGTWTPAGSNRVKFIWATPIADVSNKAIHTSRDSLTISVPVGEKIGAIVLINVRQKNTYTTNGIFLDADQSDLTPSATLRTYQLVSSADTASETSVAIEMEINTNITSQITSRMDDDLANTLASYYVFTLGYFDNL